MTAAQVASRAGAHVGLLLRVTVVVLMAALLAITAVETARAVGTDPGRPDIADFHAFAIVGRLVWEGHLADAYRTSNMMALERAMGGRDILIPYAYPPLFGLVLAPLVLLPIGVSALVFSGLTLLFFIAVLKRLAGPWFWTALLLACPAVLIDLRLGQNGLLTAGLAGLSALWLVERRGGAAGLAAGLLAALKPHLAVGLPVLFLLRRDWRALWASAVVAVVLSVAAVALLGPAAVWAFLNGLTETGRFMALGVFPLNRMVSLYACLLGFGASPLTALLVHGVVAGGVVIVAARAALGLHDRRPAAGLPLMATAFVSPYFYDYDLTVFGAGLALVLPALARALPGRRLDALLLAMAIPQSVGLLQTPLAEAMPSLNPSVGGPALLLCFGAVLAVLRAGADVTGEDAHPIAMPAREPDAVNA